MNENGKRYIGLDAWFFQGHEKGVVRRAKASER
jgi:hypothetical protein